MSTGFAFKQSLHLYSVLNLRIFLVFQLWTSKVGFLPPKNLSGAFEKRAPGYSYAMSWELYFNGWKTVLLENFNQTNQNHFRLK